MDASCLVASINQKYWNKNTYSMTLMTDRLMRGLMLLAILRLLAASSSRLLTSPDLSISNLLGSEPNQEYGSQSKVY